MDDHCDFCSHNNKVSVKLQPMVCLSGKLTALTDADQLHTQYVCPKICHKKKSENISKISIRYNMLTFPAVCQGMYMMVMTTGSYGPAKTK